MNTRDDRPGALRGFIALVAKCRLVVLSPMEAWSAPKATAPDCAMVAGRRRLRCGTRMASQRRLATAQAGPERVGGVSERDRDGPVRGPQHIGQDLDALSEPPSIEASGVVGVDVCGDPRLLLDGLDQVRMVSLVPGHEDAWQKRAISTAAS